MAGIILLQLTIAEPQMMLFAIATLYALSGPLRMVIAACRKPAAEQTATDENDPAVPRIHPQPDGPPAPSKPPSAFRPHTLDKDE